MKLGIHELPYRDQREEYVVISEQPYGGWEYSSGPTADLDEAHRKLVLRRMNRPDQRHRLGIRVTTVTFAVLPEEV